MSDTVTTTGTGGFYSTYCANRLPCGVCRIMMCNCPVHNGCGVYPVPTWNPNEVTCDGTKSGSITGVISSEGEAGGGSVSMKDYPKTYTVTAQNKEGGE